MRILTVFWFRRLRVAADSRTSSNEDSSEDEEETEEQRGESTPCAFKISPKFIPPERARPLRCLRSLRDPVPFVRSSNIRCPILDSYFRSDKFLALLCVPSISQRVLMDSHICRCRHPIPPSECHYNRPPYHPTTRCVEFPTSTLCCHRAPTSQI